MFAMHIYRGVHRVAPREIDDMEAIKIEFAHRTSSSTISLNASLSHIKEIYRIVVYQLKIHSLDAMPT